MRGDVAYLKIINLILRGRNKKNQPSGLEPRYRFVPVQEVRRIRAYIEAFCGLSQILKQISENLFLVNTYSHFINKFPVHSTKLTSRFERVSLNNQQKKKRGWRH